MTAYKMHIAGFRNLRRTHRLSPHQRKSSQNLAFIQYLLCLNTMSLSFLLDVEFRRSGSSRCVVASAVSQWIVAAELDGIAVKFRFKFLTC